MHRDGHLIQPKVKWKEEGIRKSFLNKVNPKLSLKAFLGLATGASLLSLPKPHQNNN